MEDNLGIKMGEMSRCHFDLHLHHSSSFIMTHHHSLSFIFFIINNNNKNMCFCFVQLSTSSGHLQIFGVKKQWSRHLHKVSVSHHAPWEGTMHVMVISFSGIQNHKVMSISSWRAISSWTSWISMIHLVTSNFNNQLIQFLSTNNILRSSKSGVRQVTWIGLSLGSNFTDAEIQPSCWATQSEMPQTTPLEVVYTSKELNCKASTYFLCPFGCCICQASKNIDNIIFLSITSQKRFDLFSRDFANDCCL